MFLLPVTTLLLSGPAPAPEPIAARVAARAARFEGRLGVYAKHLDTGETVEVAADDRFPTASAIKTTVLVEVFHQMAAGRVKKDQLLRLREEDKVGGSGVLHALRAPSEWPVGDLLYLMIALSDNTATNLLVDLVTTKAVDDRMVQYGLPLVRLYRATFRGGKADVFPEEEKEYGLGSATPRQMAGLFEKLARGEAVGPEASKAMLELLGRQQQRDMIPRRIASEPGVTVANKPGQDEEKRPDATGFKGTVRTDAALVTTPKGRYVIAVFARRGRDPRWTVDNEAFLAGADVSRLVYDHFVNAPSAAPTSSPR